MRILLLDPPLYRFLNETQPFPPLGLCYIASFLQKHGYNDTIIYNADLVTEDSKLFECNKDFKGTVDKFEQYMKNISNLQHPVYEDVLKKIDEIQPNIIGISIKTAKFFISKHIINKIKERYQNIIIIAGGPHVSSNWKHTLQQTKVDFCIIGEGEYAFLDLIKSVKNNFSNITKVKGVAYKVNGKIHFNGRRDLIPNIDALPFPSKNAMLNWEYLYPDQLGGIFSSRGCPFSCSFCDSRTTWTRKVRRRSPKNIVGEILYTKKKFGTNFFTFSDDCFVTQKKHITEFIDELETVGLTNRPKHEFRWWCEIHPNVINILSKDLLTKMKNAGCVAIAIGMESGSTNTLKFINKKTNINIIRNAADLIKDCNIELVCFAMIGFPWEKEKDIWETVNFFKELNPDNGNLSIVTPLPSTPLYDYCKKYNLISYDKDFKNCFHQRDKIFFSKYINEKKSAKIINETFKEIDSFINNKKIQKIFNFINRSMQDKFSDNDITINTSVTEYTLEIDFHTKSLSDEVIKSLSRNIYEEFPQYLHINFKVNSKVCTYSFSKILKYKKY